MTPKTKTLELNPSTQNYKLYMLNCTFYNLKTPTYS